MHVDNELASSSAARVLAAHAAGKTRDEVGTFHFSLLILFVQVIMPHVNSAPTKQSKINAFQRLAIQKGR